MAIRIVGTEQVQILNPNPRRKRLVVQVQSTNVDAANTGIVFIGGGFQPQNTVSAPNADYALMQSDAIDQPTQGRKLSDKWKQAIWAIASVAGQSLLVEEETEDTPLETAEK